MIGGFLNYQTNKKNKNLNRRLIFLNKMAKGNDDIAYKIYEAIQMYYNQYLTLLDARIPPEGCEMVNAYHKYLEGVDNEDIIRFLRQEFTKTLEFLAKTSIGRNLNPAETKMKDVLTIIVNNTTNNQLIEGLKNLRKIYNRNPK